MEDHVSAERRSYGTIPATQNVALHQKSAETGQQASELPFAKELTSKYDVLKHLEQSSITDNLKEKDLLVKTGDLPVLHEDLRWKKVVEMSILNVKNAFGLNNTTNVKQHGVQRVSRNNAVTSFPAKKVQSLLTHRLQPNQSQNKVLDKITIKPKNVYSNQKVAQLSEPKRSGKGTIGGPKLKKSISYQPLASEAKVTKAEAVVPLPVKDKRNFTDVVRNAVKNLEANSSQTSGLLETLARVKPSVPTLRQQSKSKRRSIKRKTKEQLETSETEQKNSVVEQSDNLLDLKQLISIDQIHQPSKKKRRGKSINKLKPSNSESKSNRTISSLKLHASSSTKSPRLVSTSRTNGPESTTKSSSRGRFISKLTLSKSAVITKRSGSILKLQESQLAVTSQKTKSASKLPERTHRSKLSVRTSSAVKVESGKASSPSPVLLSATLNEFQSTKKPTKRRASSTSGMFETKPLTSKLERSKPKMSRNANANNVNDFLEEERQQKKKHSSGNHNSPTERGSQSNKQRQGTNKCAILPLTGNEIVKSAESQSPNSKYNTHGVLEINIAKLMGQGSASNEFGENNNTNIASKGMSYNENGLEQKSKYSGFYNMYFKELVEGGVDCERESSITYTASSKSDKHKVRFNLQSSETVTESLRSERIKLRRTWSEQEFAADHCDSQLLNTTREIHRRRRWMHLSPVTRCQVTHRASRKWPNMWATILKSKKWRDMHSAQDSKSYLSREIEDEHEEIHNKTEEEEDHFETSLLYPEIDFSQEPNSDPTTSDSNLQAADRFEPRYVMPSRQKCIKLRRRVQRSHKRHDDSPKEVMFPPYECNNLGDSNSNSATQPQNMTCSFILSEMHDIDFCKNNPGLFESSAPSIPFSSNRKRSAVQLKWINLVEFVTKEVKKQCQEKGYEFLQRLSRGIPRVHSLVFLANNKNNQQYTPVEVTAIRLPYAYFTSSVACLVGSLSERRYSHTWLTELPPHKNLLMLLHRFCTHDWMYHVTQHCAWISLNNLINQSTKKAGSSESHGLSENVCKTIFRQICAGMEHLHNHDVIHGDLNCSNVLVSSTLQVKLAGYGPLCQRMINPLQTIKGNIPLQGDAYSVCTPPELMARRDTWTKSCDIWCMGITLLQMVIGEIPHEVNSAIRLSGCNSPITRLHLPTCGYQLSRLIDKILQASASNRPTVFAISNHPWLSDGTDLAVVLSRRSDKTTARRTDGSTFPLPKRLQNRTSPSNPLFQDVTMPDDPFKYPGEEAAHYPCYKSKFLRNVQPGPNLKDHKLHGSGFSETWLPVRKVVDSSTTATSVSESISDKLSPRGSISEIYRNNPVSLDSFSPKTVFMSSDSFSPKTHPGSFVPDKCGTKALTTYTARELDTSICRRNVMQGVVPDYRHEKPKGCDLLKLMENMDFV